MSDGDGPKAVVLTPLADQGADAPAAPASTPRLSSSPIALLANHVVYDAAASHAAGAPVLTRVLWFESHSDNMVVIRLGDERAWPEWRFRSDYVTHIKEGFARIEANEPYAADLQADDVTAARIRLRDFRYYAIQAVVEDPERRIFYAERGTKESGAIIRLALARASARRAEEREAENAGRTGCDDCKAGRRRTDGEPSAAWIYAWLRRYWIRGQTPNALLPDYHRSGAPGKERLASDPSSPKRGRPRETNGDDTIHPGFNATSDVIAKLRRGAERHLVKLGKSQKDAYHDTLAEEFNVGFVHWQGQLMPQLADESALPSMGQFLYYARAVRNPEREIIGREGRSAYFLRHRARTGSSAHIGPYLGAVYQVDATEADIGLLSEIMPGRYMGRATVYHVGEHWSHVTVGLHVSLGPPSFRSAMLALLNAMTDKVAFCARYGITITPDQWPGPYKPAALITDRGPEWTNKLMLNVGAGLKFDHGQVQPYRGDLKGMIESGFHRMNLKALNARPGHVTKGTRGEPDYRSTAAYTEYRLTRLLIAHILHENWHRQLEHYRAPGFHSSRIRRPTPMELWHYGIEHGGSLTAVDPRVVRAHLLPRVRGRESDIGLQVGHLCYSSPRAVAEHWFTRRSGRACREHDVTADPLDVGTVYWLGRDSGQTVVEEMSLTDKFAEFAGKSELDVDFYFTEKLADRNRHMQRDAQDEVNFRALMASIDEEAEADAQRLTAATGGKVIVAGSRDVRRLELASTGGAGALLPGSGAAAREAMHARLTSGVLGVPRESAPLPAVDGGERPVLTNGHRAVADNDPDDDGYVPARSVLARAARRLSEPEHPLPNATPEHRT
jgi:putative transposase